MSSSVTMTRRLSLLAFILAFPASAQTDNDTIRPSVKPRFQVVDGGTVKFGSQLVRLFGIDAPEKGQTCDDGQWHPGPLAKKALENLIAGRPVNCKQVDYDARNNRPVAQCFAGEDDLQPRSPERTMLRAQPRPRRDRASRTACTAARPHAAACCHC